MEYCQNVQQNANFLQNDKNQSLVNLRHKNTTHSHCFCDKTSQSKFCKNATRTNAYKNNSNAIILDNDVKSLQQNNEECGNGYSTSVLPNKIFENGTYSNKSYKTKLRPHYTVALLFVWLFVVILSFTFILFAPIEDRNENVSAAGSLAYLNIIIDLGYQLSDDDISGLLNTKVNIKISKNSTGENCTLNKWTTTGSYNYDSVYTIAGTALYASRMISWSDNGYALDSTILTSADLNSVCENSLGIVANKKIGRFEIVYPNPVNNFTITNNVVSSNGDLCPSIYIVDGYNGRYVYGCVLKAIWVDDVLPTSQTTIQANVTGDNASGIIVYIMSADGETLRQFALVGNATIVLEQNVGEKINLLVSKPYMWGMTISGASGTQNGTQYTYTVPSDSSTITINLSGGSITNNIIVI